MRTRRSGPHHRVGYRPQDPSGACSRQASTQSPPRHRPTHIQPASGSGCRLVSTTSLRTTAVIVTVTSTCVLGGALSRRSVRQRLLGAGQQWRYRSATLPRRCPLVTTDGPRGLRPQSMPALLRAPDHAIRCPDLHERTLSTLACRVRWPAVSMLRVSGWAVGRWPPATSPVEKTTLSGRSGGPPVRTSAGPRDSAAAGLWLA